MLIYHLIHFNQEKFKRFWYNLNTFCDKPFYSKNSSVTVFNVMQSTCQKYDFEPELKTIADKYYKDKSGMILFSISAVEALLSVRQFHPILVNPMNDTTVEAMQNRLVDQKIQAINPGTLVVVDKDLGLDGFQMGVLKRLSKKFQFEKIDETPKLWVFRLISASADSGFPQLLGIFDFKLYLGKNGLVKHDNLSQIKNSKRPMEAIKMTPYFKEGAVLTLEAVLEKPTHIKGIKLWHLWNTRDLLKYRFYAHNAMQNFNLLGSLDGKKWIVLASEKNYFMNDKKYYYKNVDVTIQYLRLNVIVNSGYMVVSAIEIFEKDNKETETYFQIDSKNKGMMKKTGS